MAGDQAKYKSTVYKKSMFNTFSSQYRGSHRYLINIHYWPGWSFTLEDRYWQIGIPILDDFTDTLQFYVWNSDKHTHTHTQALTHWDKRLNKYVKLQNNFNCIYLLNAAVVVIIRNYYYKYKIGCFIYTLFAQTPIHSCTLFINSLILPRNTVTIHLRQKTRIN